MLTRELAGTIVNKLMSVLGKNINLMDGHGYIIASGDPSRVGTFHEGAVRVISTGVPMEIKPEDVAVLKGVRPGINVPVTYDNKVMGAVGITGDPEEVRDYGALVRYTVELMLEQAALREQVHREERARDIYFQDLLSGNWSDEKAFIHRGSYFGFDLSLPRLALVMEFRLPSNEGTEETGVQTELLVRHNLDTVLSALRLHAQNESAITGYASANRLVYFAYWNPGRPSRERKSLADRVAGLVAKNNGYAFVIGMGGSHPGLTGLRRSYLEALEAVELGCRFYPDRSFFQSEELVLERLVSRLPQADRNAYCREVLGCLLPGTAGADKEYYRQLLATLTAYFEEGQSIRKTAGRLFLHRNTLMHRLKKIKALTGLDPSVFTDAFRLKMALLFLAGEKH